MTWLHLDPLLGQLVKNVAAQEVTIAGPGADLLGIEADATVNNKFRILSMAGGKATITGLAFQKGWAAGNGGAIEVFGGELSLQNCHLVNNNADGHGGAIAHTVPVGAGAPPDVSPLTVVGCLFSNNDAVTVGTSCGGAIHTDAKHATVTVQRSSFLYNTAGFYGGGISIVSGGNPKQVTIESANGVPTNFLQNTAQRGGAIGLIGIQVQLDVRGTHFNENLGTINSGAIYASGGGGGLSHLYFSLCTFTGNWVSNTGGGGTATGGAVLLSTQKGTFQDCTFTGNTAQNGGAIFNELGDLLLVSTTFVNNSATVGPTISYAGILNQTVWVYHLNCDLDPEDIAPWQ